MRPDFDEYFDESAMTWEDVLASLDPEMPILARLDSEGVHFLGSEFIERWSHSEAALAEIDQDMLVKLFLHHLRQGHQAILLKEGDIR